MASENTIRGTFTNADPNRLSNAFGQLGIGELLVELIKAMTPTDAGLAIAATLATLTAAPSAPPFQVKGIGGATPGIKKLLIGPITGAGAVVPATGEVVWDGGTKLKFAAIDGNLTCDVTYAKASSSASAMLRSLGERDSA